MPGRVGGGNAAGASTDGRKKLQAWMDPQLLDQLDDVCRRAGRISRRQALTEAWPVLLAEVRRRHQLEDKR